MEHRRRRVDGALRGLQVHFARVGRLGVTGGPEVPASAYAAYGPGEVAAAQWGNAAVGAAGILLLLALLLPIALRVNRWVLLVPLGALWLMTAAIAVGMLTQALLTDAGGAVFGGYCAVWATLIAAAGLGYRGRRSRAAG